MIPDNKRWPTASWVGRQVERIEFDIHSGYLPTYPYSEQTKIKGM